MRIWFIRNLILMNWKKIREVMQLEGSEDLALIGFWVELKTYHNEIFILL